MSPPPPEVHSLITTYSKYTEFTEAFTFTWIVPDKSSAGTEKMNAVEVVEHPVIVALVLDSHNNWFVIPDESVMLTVAVPFPLDALLEAYTVTVLIAEVKSVFSQFALPLVDVNWTPRPA